MVAAHRWVFKLSLALVKLSLQSLQQDCWHKHLVNGLVKKSQFVGNKVLPLLSVNTLRQLLDEVLLRKVDDLDKHNFERHVEQLLFKLS